MSDIILSMQPLAPPLLPILRSQAQAELLTYLLDEPDHETSVSELAGALRLPLATVSREVTRAERAGILTARHVGRSKLVRADTSSPYFGPLRDLLVVAFGPPALIAGALDEVPGIASVWLFGSWAARWSGEDGPRPVGDIDVLVLGEPDLGAVYEAVTMLEPQLRREVQITVRPADWLQAGEGSFHATVTSRPLVNVLGDDHDEPASSPKRNS